MYRCVIYWFPWFSILPGNWQLWCTYTDVVSRSCMWFYKPSWLLSLSLSSALIITKCKSEPSQSWLQTHAWGMLFSWSYTGRCCMVVWISCLVGVRLCKVQTKTFTSSSHFHLIKQSVQEIVIHVVTIALCQPQYFLSSVHVVVEFLSLALVLCVSYRSHINNIWPYQKIDKLLQ